MYSTSYEPTITFAESNHQMTINQLQNPHTHISGQHTSILSPSPTVSLFIFCLNLDPKYEHCVLGAISILKWRNNISDKNVENMEYDLVSLPYLGDKFKRTLLISSLIDNTSITYIFFIT